MESTTDPDFGELQFDRVWRKQAEQTLFGVTTSVEFIIEGNDANASIYDEQRLAYREFIDKNSEFTAAVENAIHDHYETIHSDRGLPQISDKSEFGNLVELTGIVFPMVLSKGSRSLGFLLECSWELENGLGVSIVDGAIEVGTQDLLT